MPKNKMNFQNTVIYKIVCKDLNVKDVYIGYTTDFTKKKCLHKKYSLNPEIKYANIQLYPFIRENGGWSNFDMIQIEPFPCNNAQEAKARERYHIEYYYNNNRILTPENKLVTPEEELSKKKEYTRIYNQANKDYFREYYKKNKDKYNKKRRPNIQEEPEIIEHIPESYESFVINVIDTLEESIQDDINQHILN